MPPSAIRKVGLLVGRERSFPEALTAEVARRQVGVEVSIAVIDAPRADGKVPYDVLVDRISHDVTCYQPFLKLAALDGVRVINNPFWRIADDKFFNVALAHRCGVPVPRTVLLPSCQYGDDVTPTSLTNLRHVDWDAVERELGYPMFLKPHWGGGWKEVHRVESRQELLDAYHSTGKLTMILQESISWTQYVRCIVIGQRDVLPALWDPRKSHFERYRDAASSMPALSPELTVRVRADALTLCQALGYQMNTVEFAIRDGIPYAIDFMNSAPDLDVSSLGESHFAWVIEKMADLVIEAALRPGKAPAHVWNELLSA